MSVIELSNITKNRIEYNNTNFMYFAEYFKTELLSGYIQKIQQLNTENFYLKIKIRKEKENKDLIIGEGICTISNLKTEAKSENKGFALTLNNKLENRQIKHIEQINNEKILLFEFVDSKLYFEFFSNNNIILTDKDNKIISCLLKEEWKDRKIARNQRYILPKNESQNILDYSPTEKDVDITKNLVSNIIKNVNVPPILIENYLLEKRVDKNTFDFKIYKKIVEGLKELYSKIDLKKTRTIIKEDKTIFINLDLNFLDRINLDLNSIINDLVLKKEIYSNENLALKKYDKERKNIEHILDEQKKAKDKILIKANKAKEIGDFIYNNFEFFERLKNEIKSVIEKRKTNEEIKTKLDELNTEYNMNLKFEKIEKEKGKIIFLMP